MPPRRCSRCASFSDRGSRHLVPHLEQDAVGYVSGGSGQIRDARALRETIRQNAITYPVPRGPIDTLLYSAIKNLIYSPQVTQSMVRSQFRNVMALLFLAICFLVSILGLRNGAAVAWIALFYFVVTNVLVLRPLASGRPESARFSSREVVIFIAGSIIGPVVLAGIIPKTLYPFHNTIVFTPVTFSILFASLAVSALLLMAGIGNTVNPNTIAAAPHLETPSMNATPTQLFVELAREMKRLWVEEVPNRTYMRLPPNVAANHGEFDAHLIEETQPLAQDLDPLTLQSALALATTRWLLAADVLGTLLTSAGAWMLTQWGQSSNANELLLYGSSMLVVGAFAFRGANRLWRRFEFKSRLYWIECHGSYARASTKVGSVLRDRIHTERESINVEMMTLRVWVAEVDSVAFDTDRTRDMVSLRGLPGEAQRVGRHLAAFGTDQASVIVPGSSVDLQRLALADRINPKASDADTLADAYGLSGSQAAKPTLDVSQASKFCTNCGLQLEANQFFCGACGQKR